MIARSKRVNKLFFLEKKCSKQRKSYIQKFDEVITSLLARLLKLITLFMLIVLILQSFITFSSNRLAIDKIEVPSSLNTYGYTEEFISRNVLSKVKSICNEASSDIIAKDYVNLNNKPNIVTNISGLSMSLGDVISSIGGFLGFTPQTIKGEMIDGQKELILHLTIAGDQQVVIRQPIENGTIDNLDNAMNKIVFSAAIQILNKTDPGYMAFYFYQKKDFESSKNLIEQVLKRPDENRKFAFNLLGKILDRKGRSIEAIKEYLKAIKIDGEFISAYNNLGIACYNFNDSKIQRMSISLLKEANAIDKSGLYKYSRYSLGKAYTKLGIYDSAIISYNESLKIDPNYIKALNNLAYVHRLKGNYNESIEIVESTLRRTRSRSDLALLWSTWAESKYYLNDIDSFYYGVAKSCFFNSNIIRSSLKDEPYSCFKDDAYFIDILNNKEL